MYNACIDTDESVMFFKNLMLRIFLSIVEYITRQVTSGGSLVKGATPTKSFIVYSTMLRIWGHSLVRISVAIHPKQ